MHRRPPLKAKDLSVGDIGKTFVSLTYPNNNKTAKPQARGERNAEGRYVWVVRPRHWTLQTLYAHENGNIKINNYFHLRADTELERVND